LWCFAPPHFANPGLATQALIRVSKTSVTCHVMCHFQVKVNNINKILSILQKMIENRLIKMNKYDKFMKTMTKRNNYHEK
jgi:hypothetical protein